MADAADEMRPPLQGRRIAVTRPRAQSFAFAEQLRRLGAEVQIAPMIAIEDAPDPEAVRSAARQADRFDWMVFTSANAVEKFWSALESLGASAPSFEGVAICAVGTATAEAVEKRGARVALIPQQFVGEGVVSALSNAMDPRGKRVLFVRAESARAVIPESLRELGAEVVEVVAYRTVTETASAEGLRRAIRDGEVDVVTFTSSSAVQAFIEGVEGNTGSALVATIGPVTSSTARAAGLRVDIEAEPYTTEGLAAKIVQYYAERKG